MAADKPQARCGASRCGAGKGQTSGRWGSLLPARPGCTDVTRLWLSRRLDQPGRRRSGRKDGRPGCPVPRRSARSPCFRGRIRAKGCADRHATCFARNDAVKGGADPYVDHTHARAWGRRQPHGDDPQRGTIWLTPDPADSRRRMLTVLRGRAVGSHRLHGVALGTYRGCRTVYRT